MKYPAEELKLGLQGGPPKEYQKILTFSTIYWEHADKIFSFVENVTYINFVVFK